MFENNITKIFRLFTIHGCPQCHIWKSVLPDYNIYLSGINRIVSIDCTRYHDFGYVSHPDIKRFAKYVQGVYPTFLEAHLDFSGRIVAIFKRDGANSEVEVREWIRAFLNKNMPRFIKDKKDDILFNEEEYEDNCKIKRNIFGGVKIQCDS